MRFFLKNVKKCINDFESRSISHLLGWLLFYRWFASIDISRRLN